MGNRTIMAVFKVIVVSLLLMLSMNLIFLTIDSIVLYNRLSTLIPTIQRQVADHNCMPHSLATGFEKQLNEIVERSGAGVSVRTNFTKNLSTDGKTYPSINESNAGNYGDVIQLVIVVKVEPWHMLLNIDATQEAKNSMGYDLTFTESITCLRYLK